MPISTSFRLSITAINRISGGVGIGEWQLRTVPGVARPFVEDGVTASVTNTGPASLQGPGTLPQLKNTYSYDEFVVLTLPFSVQIGHLSTTQVLVSSYGMLMFGHDGTVHNWFYNLDDGDANPFPTIVHGSAFQDGASGFNALYAGAENGGATYRIRLEMYAGWGDAVDKTTNTVWEVTFYQATPDKIRIDFGTSGYAGVDGGQGVAAGIGDGSSPAHIGSFPQGVVNQAYEVFTDAIVAEGVMTASAGNEFAMYAGDGDTQTIWATPSNVNPSPDAPITLTYTFNAPINIKEYVVQAWGWQPVLDRLSMPKDWTFEYLDGGTWKVADTQAEQSGWTEDETRTFIMPSNDGEMTLPALVVEGVGNLDIDSLLGDNMTIQPLQVDADMSAGDFAQIFLPRMTLSGSGIVSPVSHGDITLPRLTLRATTLGGQTMDGNSILPGWQLAGALDSALPLPELAVSGYMSTGTVSSGRITLLRMTLSGAMEPALPLPELTVEATAIAGVAASGTITLQQLQLDGSIVAGGAAHGEIALPLLQVAGGEEGAVTLAPLTVAATGQAGAVINGNAVLRALLVEAFGDNGAEIALPRLQLAATAAAGTVAHGNVQLLHLQVGGGTQELIALQPLQLAGTATSGAHATGNVVLDRLTLSATAAPQDGFAHGAVQLAQLATNGQMAGGTEAQGNLRLPAMGLSAQASAGPMGEGAITLPLATLAGTAYASNEAAGDVNLRAWQVAASAAGENLVHGAVQLESLRLDGSIVAGNTGVATITLPLLAVSAGGFYDTVGTATIELPALQLDAVGEAGASTIAAPVFTSVVVNTRNRAASTYEGLGFNSMATFNGVVLGASASGIVALTGDDDNGAPVNAVLAGGVSDLDSPQFKRVLAGYVGYSAAGNVELTMITDTHHEYVYALAPRQVSELHAARVKFGRGVEGRYWQWRLANRLGADFALDKLTLDVSPLSRRI